MISIIARADHKQLCVNRALINEVVAVLHARLKSRAVAGVERFATCVGNKNNFTLKHPDKFVLMYMPMSLRGPGAGLDPHKIHAELGQI